jgi:hypothetical protein
MRKKIAILYTMVMLVVPLVIIIASYGIPEKARAVPLLTGALTLLLGILALICEIVPRIGKIFEAELFTIDTGEAKKEPDPAVEEVSISDLTKKILGCLALMVGFFIMIWLVGFFLAVPVFVFSYFMIFAQTRWINAILVTLVTEAFVFVVFQYLMGFELFQGILFGDIPPPFF